MDSGFVSIFRNTDSSVTDVHVQLVAQNVWKIQSQDSFSAQVSAKPLCFGVRMEFSSNLKAEPRNKTLNLKSLLQSRDSGEKPDFS